MKGKGQGPKDQFWYQERAIDAQKNTNCGQCGYNFQTMKEIMFHVKNTADHAPYCVHCDSKFSNYQNYGAHVRKFHLENRVFTCEDCGKTSKTKERHQLHWNYAHKVENTFHCYCDFCGLKSKNKSKSRQHMRYCKQHHPALAVAEGLRAQAVTEELKNSCEGWTFDQFVEWKDKVFEDSIDCQNNPEEFSIRAKKYMETILENAEMKGSPTDFMNQKIPSTSAKNERSFQEIDRPSGILKHMGNRQETDNLLSNSECFEDEPCFETSKTKMSNSYNILSENNQEIITNKAGGEVDEDLRKEIEDQINEDLKEINVEKIDKTDIIRLRGTV